MTSLLINITIMAESSKLQNVPPTDIKEEVEELLKSMRTCIDQEEHAKWISEGKKYEEHEEVLMQQNHQKNDFFNFNHMGYDGYGIPFQEDSAGRSTRKTREESNHTTSTKRSKTNNSNNGKYRNKTFGHQEISNSV